MTTMLWAPWTLPDSIRPSAIIITCIFIVYTYSICTSHIWHNHLPLKVIHPSSQSYPSSIHRRFIVDDLWLIHRWSIVDLLLIVDSSIESIVDLCSYSPILSFFFPWFLEWVYAIELAFNFIFVIRLGNIIFYSGRCDVNTQKRSSWCKFVTAFYICTAG